MSNDGILSQRVICQGGLNTSANFLELSNTSPGSATRLVNYETSVFGGYRRINGFVKFDDDEVGEGSAEGRVLGLIGFRNDVNGDYEIIAARKDTGVPTYSFYLWANPGWTPISTGLTHNTTDGTADITRIRTSVFNFGQQNHIIFVDGVNFATVYNGATWYQLESGNTGGTLSPGGDQVLDKPSLVTVFKNHLFLSGDYRAPSAVAYSGPSLPDTWTAAGGGGQQIVGFPVVQIKPFRDEIYLFGRDQIKKSVPDPTSAFVLQNVTGNLGCTAPDSVLEVAGSLIFLSPDGIRPIAGTSNIGDVEIATISPSIQSTLYDLDQLHNLDDLNGVVIRRKNQFRYFLSTDAVDTVNAYGILGTFKIKPQGSPWEFGELRGIRSHVAWSGYLEQNEEYILHGDYNGYVYKQEEGSSFDGGDITAIYTTPFLDSGDTEIRKVSHCNNIFIRAEGNVSIDISVVYNWGETNVINPANYNLTSSFSGIQYDDGNLWDGGAVYGQITSPVLKNNLQGSAFSIQLSFTSVGTFAPYTIQGFVLEFSPQGRY